MLGQYLPNSLNQGLILMGAQIFMKCESYSQCFLELVSKQNLSQRIHMHQCTFHFVFLKNVNRNYSAYK